MLTQFDVFLTTKGLIAGLQQAQTVVKGLEPDLQTSVATKKLGQITARLKGIFFDGLTDEAIETLLRTGVRFGSDYPGLQQMLSALFVDKASMDEMLGRAALGVPPDWTPIKATVDIHYQAFNTRHGYFQNATKQAALKQLFTQLVIACRSIAVLVEQNNTADDAMAYDYAYKLMALFVDDSKPIPSIEQLSTPTNGLLSPQKHTRTPFHDVLLVQVRLPDARLLKDKSGWMAFIKKAGERALPFFAMAPQLEDKSAEKAPSTIREAKAAMALCTYARAALDPEFASLCYEYKAPEEMFDHGLDYMALSPAWPKKTTDTIPNVVIQGQGVMAEDKDLAAGYYWVKLPPADKRALILGKITDCCQSIGDSSSQCVKDAVSLSDNGLYVLLKHKRGDKAASPIHEDGSINKNFQIIGQSYVWKSKTGNLCLDSIECLRDSVPDRVLKKIMFDFATQVMAEDTTIKRVNVGQGGRTPRGLFKESAIPEAIRQGVMYGDADTQYCIKSLTRTLSIAQQDELDALLSRYACSQSFKNCLDYLLGYVTNDPTETIEQLATLLERYPEFKDDLKAWSLFRFLSWNASPKITDFYPVDLDALETMTPARQIETLRDISWAQLIWNVSSLEKIMRILPFLPIEQRLGIVKEKDTHGACALHWAVTNPGAIAAILSLLPKDQRLEAVKEKDRHGANVLDYAADNPKTLAMLLALYPEGDRVDVLKERMPTGINRLEHCAAMKSNGLAMVLALLPKLRRLDVVKDKNNYYGKSLLHYAAYNPESLAVVLKIYPQRQRLKAVKDKDNHDNSVLDYAANPKALAVVLEIYPQRQRLKALKLKEEYSPFKRVCSNAESLPGLIEILKLLPKAQRCEAARAGSMKWAYLTQQDFLDQPLAWKDSPDSQPKAPTLWRRFFHCIQRLIGIILRMCTRNHEALLNGDLSTPKKKDQTKANPPEQPHHGNGYPFFGTLPRDEAASPAEDLETTHKPHA